ncbi:hypothetical protein CEXT_368421 [Caerostris extrusa]|uniref:Uncharacterized protein n=1 Tax=Caerostris extrusa TaxID=172846 RepID=A0AAV4TI61_CAEEX|nr:hypothetical protein CEXT_368421 [Caerostris extrusa]
MPRPVIHHPAVGDCLPWHRLLHIYLVFTTPVLLPPVNVEADAKTKQFLILSFTETRTSKFNSSAFQIFMSYQ